MREGLGTRIAAAVVPVTAIAIAWAAIERHPPVGTFAGVALLSLAAALPRRPAVRIGIAASVVVGLVLLLAGTSRDAVRNVAARGLSDIYAVAPPIVPATHHDLHVLMVLTAAGLCLAVAAVASTRPFVAAVIVAVGVGWPATVMPARNTVAMGALGLLAALWPLVVPGARSRHVLVPGVTALAAIVAAAMTLAGAGARPSAAALDWQSWDLFGQSSAQRTVRLVWSSSYTGIDFPADATTVLRVEAPHRALYWRATTLDLFTGDRWVEALYSTGQAQGDSTLPPDALLPAAARRPRRWIRQDVDVRALVDDHVVAAGQPMRVSAGAERRLRFLTGGVVRSRDGAGDLRRYRVWSYAPDPSPAALVRSPARYPVAIGRYLDVGRAMAPGYGVQGRAAEVDALFRDTRYQPMWDYRPLWRKAAAVAAGSGSPYEATERIERWLRSDGGFAYDEHPPAPGRLPPLVDFVERTKLGYCQHFAGTMALMLRYLGIPARVAVGFTSGSWKNGTWTVTDHDAHAWVEAWFSGYGWLTFDPTPGRGRLSATYTNASDSADAVRALGTGRFLDLGRGGRVTPAKPAPAAPAAESRRRAWPLAVPFAAVALVLTGLWAVKDVRRRRRAHVSDPRRRASAARAELVDYVRDQGAPLPHDAPVMELAGELRRLGVASDGFARAFARARYGPADGAAAAAEETRLELQRAVALLRERLGPGRRLRGFLRVRSLRDG